MKKIAVSLSLVLVLGGICFFYKWIPATIVLPLPEEYVGYWTVPNGDERLFQALCQSLDWRVCPTKSNSVQCYSRKYNSQWKDLEWGCSVYPILFMSGKDLFRHDGQMRQLPIRVRWRRLLSFGGFRGYESTVKFPISARTDITVNETSTKRKRDLTELFLLDFAQYLTEAGREKVLRESFSVMETDNTNEIEIISYENRGLTGGVVGWVNLGQPGYLKVDVKGYGATGKMEWMECRSSPECVGWSSNKNEKFYFDLKVLIPGDGRETPACLSLYFTPFSSDESPCLVYSTNLLIQTWVR